MRRFVFLLLAALPLVAAAADAPPLIPIIAKKSTTESVRISPTGQHLAVTYPVGETDQTALAIVEVRK